MDRENTTDLARQQQSPAAFSDALLIDADRVRFGPSMDDWQRADLAAIDPALHRVVGQDVQAVLPRLPSAAIL